MKGTKAKNGFYTISYLRALKPTSKALVADLEAKKAPDSSDDETLDSKRDELMQIDETKILDSKKARVIKPDSISNTLELWHERLAHISPSCIVKAVNDKLVLGCDLKKEQHVRVTRENKTKSEHDSPQPKLNRNQVRT